MPDPFGWIQGQKRKHFPQFNGVAWEGHTLAPVDLGMPTIVGAPSVWANSGAGALQYVAPSGTKVVLAAPSGLGTDLSFVTLDNTYIANRTRQFWIPAAAFVARTGAPTLASRGTNNIYEAWSFTNGAINDVITRVVMPADYVSAAITINFYVTNLGAGSGNVVWAINTLDRASAGDLNSVAGLIAASQTVAAPAQNLQSIITSTISFTPTAQPNSFLLLVQRTGTSGSDTLGNAAGFLGAEIFYTADM